MARKRKWYSGGLRFECTQCGQCCSGPSGLVEFTDAEAAAMAEHLELSRDEFLEQYAFQLEGRWFLKEVEGPPEVGFDCALLERDPQSGLTRCVVHAHRPTQCRTWPFWPENLRNPRAWKYAGRQCEGIDRGPLVSYEEIRRARDATP